MVFLGYRRWMIASESYVHEGSLHMYILSAVCIVVAFVSALAASGGAGGGAPSEPAGYLAILAVVFSVISTLVDGRTPFERDFSPTA